MTRLFLLGDGEVADILAELAQHIGYDELHHGGDVPATLGPDDHVVVCAREALRGRELMARLLAAGDPGYLGLVATEKEALVSLLKLSADRVAKARLDRIAAPAGVPVGAVTAGEQAISVAAELIAARRNKR
jgi:xanthine dehydrogenase accessory factor